MLVAVMQIRIMRVLMEKPRVAVPVAVGLPGQCVRRVLM